jgi:DNA-binding NarL/FixJ family response regulator
MRSGHYGGARASLRAGGSEVPVEFVARLEFVDEGCVAIDLELAERPVAAGSERSDVQLLTARERDVITLIAMGLETRQIAEELHVSASTVRTHVRNSMAKVGAHTRAHLVAVAMAGQEPVEVGHADNRMVDKSARWGIDQASRRVDR